MAKKKNIIRAQAGFQEKFIRSNLDFVVGGGAAGGGKCLGINELVLTPTGWVRNGDLQIGQYISTPFGAPAMITGIYDHKDKDLYYLKTSDGRKSLCGLEHLWSFRTRKQMAKYRLTQNPGSYLTTETTEQLIERLNNGKDVYIPIPYAQEFEEKEYTIPPYVLGVLIGDGVLTDKGNANSKNCFAISNTEQDIINKVALLSGAKRVYSNPSSFTKMFYTDNALSYETYLTKSGLNTYSYNKFIPEEYLWGSIEQRKELLFGLMDTDGNVGDKNRFSYSTTSKRLADDFIYLCRSLGYIATINIDKRVEKYTSGATYDINIQTNDIIFSSDKHLSRYKENLLKYKNVGKYYNDHVRVVSIEKEDKCDARCLWIDDNLHLYITNDFLTTHNTFAACMSIAESSLDGKFRGLFLRNNLGDLKSGGGILDTFREIYGNGCRIAESGEPRVDFPSGASIDVTHVADQSREKVLQRFKGRQYDFVYFDEGTGFSWDCFTAIFSRNRGKAAWTGKVRMTTNPEREHWLRTFLDWYIGNDGYIREDRDGVVRYFYINGNTVKDVVWGNTKEEVYEKCYTNINRVISSIDKKAGTQTDWRTLIKSFTFYQGKTSENKIMLKNNEGYLGSIAVMGEKSAKQMLEGNWNVSMKDDDTTPISTEDANRVFVNDPRVNGDKWVTCDLADTGTDNLVMLAWNGLHVEDVKIVGHTTPRQNAEILKEFAASHNIGDEHIIYDAIRGTYINDYIPDAVQFVSYKQPIGIYGRNAMRLKDECYLRLVDVLKRGDMSFDDKISGKRYEHQNIKEYITIQSEFIDECLVVRFETNNLGKKQLFSKKAMNKSLGKTRSMDLLDPCAMRMFPLLHIPYGEELERSRAVRNDNDYEYSENQVSIYDETLWQ